MSKLLQKKPFSAFLTESGDGLGSVDANSDFSSTQGRFYYSPSNESIVLAKQIIITLSDTGIFQFRTCGAGVSLSNGIRIKANLSGSDFYLDGGLGISSNADFGSICHSINQVNFGLGSESIFATISLDKIVDDGLLLSDSDSIEVLIDDDLSGLDRLRFLIEGEVIMKPFEIYNQKNRWPRS